MAYYINNRNIIQIASTLDGLDMIRSFLFNKEGEMPHYELQQRSEGNFHIFMTHVSLDYNRLTHLSRLMTGCFSTSIVIGPKQILINPSVDQNGVNYTVELVAYIESLPSLFRDRKLEEICGI